MVRGRGTLLVAGLVLAVVAAPSGRAHFAPRERSLHGLVREAGIVVIGVIEEMSQNLRGGHFLRPSSGRIRVEAVLKGPTVAGGRIGFTSAALHQTVLGAGDRAILFLSPAKPGEPFPYVLLQSSTETIRLGDAGAAEALEVVRSYIDVEATVDPQVRIARLAQMTLRLLHSEVPTLWQSALFDLFRLPEIDFQASEVRQIGRLARNRSKAPALRAGCIAKLGSLAVDQPTAVAELERIADPPLEATFRTIALAALEESGSPRALDRQLRALRDRSPVVRRAALEALGRMGDPSAVPAIEVLAADENDAVRFAALKTLLRIEGPAAAQALARIEADGANPERITEIGLARRQVGDAPPSIRGRAKPLAANVRRE